MRYVLLILLLVPATGCLIIEEPVYIDGPATCGAPGPVGPVNLTAEPPRLVGTAPPGVVPARGFVPAPPASGVVPAGGFVPAQTPEPPH